MYPDLRDEPHNELTEDNKVRPFISKRLTKRLLSLGAATLPLILTSCFQHYPKVGPCQALGQSECDNLQTIASKYPVRSADVPQPFFGEKRFVPGVTFWVSDDFNFNTI